MILCLKHVDDIIQYFENHYDFDFNNLEPIKINEHETITDLQKFLYNHISILKHNTGNKRFLPYYERLKKVYLISKI